VAHTAPKTARREEGNVAHTAPNQLGEKEGMWHILLSSGLKNVKQYRAVKHLLNCVGRKDRTDRTVTERQNGQNGDGKTERDRTVQN